MSKTDEVSDSNFTKEATSPKTIELNFKCDFEPEDEVLHAIQTILNAISSDRKKLNSIQHERDSLLSLLRTFETERFSDDLLTTEMKENRRKRVKRESLMFNESSDDPDNTNADLNAAFRSSISESPPRKKQQDSQDEVIEPTQFSPVKSKKILQELYLENDVCKTTKRESTSLVTKESSPTVLSKRSSIKTALNESPKWHSKAPSKNNTPRRLFDSRTAIDANSSTPQYQQLNSRKKLGLNSLCLKQSTINFPKCEEETFCEVMQQPSTSKIKREPQTYDSVIALAKDTNEIIIVNESQPTQEIYQHVLDSEEGFNAQLGQNLSRKMINTRIECEDCNEYHRKLGRDVEKNPPRKFGICSKHHRNVQVLDTPPGFWNPKIIDSESDEDTPYDYHFGKK
ncbi:uncharacterized protein LOC129571037 [Sitodiplosis mosellana]|uniref:uncharacterized protein LOC129571037 n=1 Tax=Sitodiplosis mosellana TaxID=263140 RepID=UPI002443B586|nr:uncharacterized protein LOC129571037 [Sitodiplosis mosellana]XP_055306750.1 uncharacterized protein LOC129571037 [Sitodiplosis mosellana]